MPLSRLPVPAACLLLAACGSDVAVVQQADDPACDGVKQQDEETVDAPFDNDGDGYVDGDNPDCQETYAATLLDCDDGDAAIHPAALEIECNGVDDDCNALSDDDPDSDGDGWGICTDCDETDDSVHPGASETTCNGVDDDCDAATADEPDDDGDGESACTDCDDLDALRSTRFAEVCEDETDNDCDGEVDEECEVDLTGTWILDSTVSYSCAFGLGININLGSLSVVDNNPDLAITAGASQPGTMTGSFTTETSFYVDNTISGSCTEYWFMTGDFVDAETLTGTLSLRISGSGCFDCSNQDWAISAWR